MQLKPKDIVRFWAKVQKGISAECWPWTGCADRDGYGLFYFNSKLKGAHRVAYFLYTGEDPGSEHVCHTCDNPTCVNGAHLFLGSRDDNMRDMVLKHRAATKITEAQVREIMRLLGTGDYIHSEIASQFGISRSQVGRISRGTTWRVVTGFK